MDEFIQLYLCLDLVFANNDLKDIEDFTPIFIHMNKNYLSGVFKLKDAYKYDKAICAKYRFQYNDWLNHNKKIYDYNTNSYVKFGDSIYCNCT